jgi:hypothetical protein
MARATTSLPVPVSPVIRTVAFVGRHERCARELDSSQRSHRKFRSTFQSDDCVFEEDVFAEGRVARSGCATDSGSDDFRLRRFREEVECALAHALDCEFYAGYRCEKNDWNRGVDFVNQREDCQSVAVGHFLIGDDDIEIIGSEHPLCFLDSARFEDLMLVLAQVGGEDAPHVGFVVHEKDSAHDWIPSFEEFDKQL